MTILVVGSVAFDNVTTPFGSRERVLGGSATYFSCAASFFHPVRLVAVVGRDFSEADMAVFRERGIDTAGLAVDQGGDTFRWKGEYGYDLNDARTLETHLNVFERFKPALPEPYRDSEWLFLANIDPAIQREVVGQVREPRMIACDTMNFWIQGRREELIKTLAHIDVLVINEAEARMLGGESNLVRSARRIKEMGPAHLVVKRGEYGVILFEEESIFALPAFPLEDVFDPTGAGDSFAGGFMGSLAKSGRITLESLRRSIVYGQVMASFNVESFGLDRLRSLTFAEVEARFQHFRALTRFEDVT